MNIKEQINKAKREYPIGAKVKWSGKYFIGFQSGEGVITKHVHDKLLKLFQVELSTHKGKKKYTVADLDNPNFNPKEIKVISTS